jgi:hypothetical protein
MSAEIQEVVASIATLAEMAAHLDALVGRFSLAETFEHDPAGSGPRPGAAPIQGRHESAGFTPPEPDSPDGPRGRNGPEPVIIGAPERAALSGLRPRATLSGDKRMRSPGWTN